MASGGVLGAGKSTGPVPVDSNDLQNTIGHNTPGPWPPYTPLGKEELARLQAMALERAMHFARKPMKCPSCGAWNESKNDNCQHCGTPLR